MPDLRQVPLSREGHGGAHPDMEHALAHVPAEVVHVEEVPVDSRFFDDLGADSLLMAYAPLGAPALALADVLVLVFTPAYFILIERTMAVIGDACTLNSGSVIQCHAQEDGAFKSDHTTLGSGCTSDPAAVCSSPMTRTSGGLFSPGAGSPKTSPGIRSSPAWPACSAPESRHPRPFREPQPEAMRDVVLIHLTTAGAGPAARPHSDPDERPD
ncbi:hypothetical protein ACFZAR_22475 [Streptomyces sp. NPDC008222]|uniref:hypothetical protein n=1 Tax=Streptomyces sp. NPDC008222 TaxID=3364820 RepID=UPI0036E0A6AD